MRKVQEFFSRFGYKKHPLTAEVLAEKLRVPPQQSLENSEFPSDPDEVKSWFLTHNAFGATDSIQTLLHALQQCNGTENSVDNRIAIMQHFEKPCVHALQSLDTRYLYLDFPLQDDAERAFATATTLCEEMAHGYKLALRDSLVNQNCLSKKASAEVISKIMEQLGRVALRHSMAYRQWPATLWQDANTLIQIVQQEGIASFYKRSQQPRIFDQYAHLCAFNILATGNFQAPELRGLFTDLTELVSQINFQRKPTGTSIEHYCIANNNPPTQTQFTRYNKKDNPLYFSTQVLIQQLHNRQLANENNIPSYLTHLDSAPDKPRRASARAIRDCAINAVTGLDDIYTVMSTMAQATDFESQYTNPAELVTQSELTQWNGQALLSQTENKNFGSGFVAENQSDSGIGLRLNRAGSSQVQVGELIAHSYGSSADERNWHIGVIKWLKTEQDKTLKLGVETISNHCKPVAIRRLLKGKTVSDTSIDGLLANYQPIDNKVPQLLLPAHTFKAGETVKLKDDDGIRQVKLIECIKHNSQFQSFAITQSGQLKLVTNPSVKESGTQVAASA